MKFKFNVVAGMNTGSVRLLRRSLRPRRGIQTLALDHVCVCVRDVGRAVQWYTDVFGLELAHADADHFWPRDPMSPAFLRLPGSDNSSGGSGGGGGGVDLLQLGDDMPAIKDHRGAHFALRVSQDDFARARAGGLKARLMEHNPPERPPDCEYHDYGLQRSLFVKDLDDNVVELCAWGFQKISV